MMINRTLVFAVVAIVLASCSKGDVFQSNGNGLPVPLSVSSTSLSAAVTKGAVTTGGTIGVFLAKDDSKGYVAQNNVKYEYTDNNKWENKGLDKIYLNNNFASVCAYYPYEAIGSGSNSSSFSLTSQKYDANADLCYAQNITGLNNNSATVDFTMNHAYSKITFIIVKGSYSGVSKIDEIRINNSVLQAAGLLNITNGEYIGNAVESVFFNPDIASIDAYDAANESTVKTVSILMVPVQTLTDGKVTLSFKVDGSVRTTLPIKLAELAQGQNYTIHIILNGTTTIVSPVSCGDWTVVSGLPVISPQRP